MDKKTKILGYVMTMCKEEEEILSKLDRLIDAAIDMGGEAALKALGEKLNTSLNFRMFFLFLLS